MCAMTRAGVVDRALDGLKHEYSCGAIGLDTFESQVATVLAEDWPPQPVSLLAALLDKRRVAFLGRSSECQLVLADDTVSRMHAMIARAGDRFVLTDLESTNGTMVNGRPIKQAQVRAGDRITLGVAELLL